MDRTAKIKRAPKLTVAATALLAALSPALAQTSPAHAPDATVVLPTFTITETSPNPYQSTQALSTSRVAMDIQDIPQTVSVVTSQLIADTLGQRMLDVAKYVTPIVESSLTTGSDRYHVRGFQVSAEFVDGTIISGQDGYSMSLAPYNIERIEIIKGPNAILMPGGSPGGVMNPITKAPIQRNQASVTLELAEYYGTAVSTDINRVINDDQAARVVAAYWRSDGYAKNQYRHGYLFAPSYSFQLSDKHKLVVKGEVMQNRETNLSGLPIDPSVGSDDNARIARGLPRDWSFGDKTDTRHRATERLTGELYSTLSDHITSRLVLMGNHVIRSDVGGTNASIAGLANGLGGSRNPFTGKWEPGIVWNVDNSGAEAVVTSTVAPIPDPSTWIYNRVRGRVYLEYTEAHLKNDYAARFASSWFTSTTTTGFSANTSKVHFKSYPNASRAPVPANNLNSITYGDYAFQQPSAPSNGTDKTGKQEDLQLFLYENISFLEDRVMVSGGISRFFGELKRTDNTGIGLVPGVPSDYSLSDSAYTFGIVAKPIRRVSLFYGYNTSGGQMPGSLAAGTVAPSLRVADGDQHEYGIKTSLLDGRLTASFAYFDIAQSNYPAPNSEYYVLVSQGITPPPDFPSTLYLDLTSKGWEVEASYALGKNLTVLGNYSKFELRQPYGLRYRAVPDQNGGLYLDYRFTEGRLSGFGINFGADYKGQAPGDLIGPGFTSAKPLPGSGPDFVVAQPSFMVASRTVANLGFSYRAPTWTARLTIANVFDKDYIQAALNRNSLFPGDPRSLKASFTYNF
jgi:iron complex outermembrane recepter protein